MGNKAHFVCLSFLLAAVLMISGCGRSQGDSQTQSGERIPDTKVMESEEVNRIQTTSEIVELEDGFSTVRYDGDYGFAEFLAQGGAASDREVVQYLAENLLDDFDLGDLLGGIFGCSTIAVSNADGDVLFGRNFDWNTCEAMVVESHPLEEYASLATVNMNFITQSISGMLGAVLQLDQVRTLAALYAPLDGMNEAGLAVSVNMIQDSATIDQDTDKPDITTTTAVRLLLDQAANVEEALELLSQYDLHASMGMMIHLALADADGRSVVVEYVENEMIVMDTPVVTNFYLAEGEKNGIGTAQSHERYNILMELLEQKEHMEASDVKDALDSVSKDNFDEFASTEWSAVFNLHTGEARYYHRENYEKSYVFSLK